MTANRSNWLQRVATIVILVALLIPMFFGGVRSVRAASTIFVDDSWVGTNPGDDPDGLGPATSFGTDSFATIQEAVDVAVGGDTVQVYAGTYVEQVTISQNITLITTEGAVIKAFPTMPQDCTSPSLQENRPIVCVNGGVNATVTIDGFTIDGDNKGDTNPKLMGIAFRNAGGIIQNNTIVNIRPPTVSNTAGGTGIYVYNTDTALRTVAVLANTLHDFNENGISITTSFNSGNRTEFLIDGNTIEGIVGPSGLYNSTVPQNGIQVRVPAGGGIIQNNTISKIAFNNNGKPPFVGVSILSISTPVDSKNNVISGAQAGIVYFNDLEDLGNYREISGNQIQVFKPGTVANPGQNVYGILVTDRPKDILSPVDPPALAAVNGVLMGAPLSIAIKNNTISYVGALSNTKTFGIEIDAGVGTSTTFGDNVLSAEVTQNRISGVTSGFDAGLLFYQCDPANPPVGIIACGAGSFDTSRIVSNDITGNNYGVWLEGPIVSPNLDDFHHNRIAGNGVGVQNNTGSEILMINNWWGCNAGPGTPGCDIAVSVNPGFSDPWLVLSTTANPITVPVGGTSILTADLKFNSAAADTSGVGFVTNGIPVTFSVATLGSVNPLNGVTASGATQTTFTAPIVGGTFQVCATVDSETVCSDVTEDQPLKIFLPLISK